MAMKQAVEYLRGLRYKLHMFGIPADEPVFIYGDNQSVLVIASEPESTLKKKNQSIAFHFICKGCTTDEWRTKYIQISLNVSDLMKERSLRGETMALCQDSASPHLVWQNNQHWGADGNGVGHGRLVPFLLVAT